MADLPPDLDPNRDETGIRRARGSAPSTPRWVLVLGVIAVILVVAFVVQAVLGGGHGPGMHAPSGEAGTLAYACHEPGHYQAGMRGQLTVS